MLTIIDEYNPSPLRLIDQYFKLYILSLLVQILLYMSDIPILIPRMTRKALTASRWNYTSSGKAHSSFNTPHSKAYDNADATNQSSVLSQAQDPKDGSKPLNTTRWSSSGNQSFSSSNAASSRRFGGASPSIRVPATSQGQDPEIGFNTMIALDSNPSSIIETPDSFDETAVPISSSTVVIYREAVALRDRYREADPALTHQASPVFQKSITRYRPHPSDLDAWENTDHFIIPSFCCVSTVSSPLAPSRIAVDKQYSELVISSGNANVVRSTNISYPQGIIRFNCGRT